MSTNKSPPFLLCDSARLQWTRTRAWTAGRVIDNDRPVRTNDSDCLVQSSRAALPGPGPSSSSICSSPHAVACAWLGNTLPSCSPCATPGIRALTVRVSRISLACGHFTPSAELARPASPRWHLLIRSRCLSLCLFHILAYTFDTPSVIARSPFADGQDGRRSGRAPLGTQVREMRRCGTVQTPLTESNPAMHTRRFQAPSTCRPSRATTPSMARRTTRCLRMTPMIPSK